MDRKEARAYPPDMRVAGLLFIAIGFCAPALAQPCEGSGVAGDVYRTRTEQGAQAVGWDVKRVDGVGVESDHFPRPQLSLTFATDAVGKMTGPVAAQIMVSRYSDKDVGEAPTMSVMRIRARADGKAVGDWRGDDYAAQAGLAGWLRDSWPREVEVDVVGPAGEVAASAVFDLSTRAEAQAIARCGR